MEEVSKNIDVEKMAKLATIAHIIPGGQIVCELSVELPMIHGPQVIKMVHAVSTPLYGFYMEKELINAWRVLGRQIAYIMSGTSSISLPVYGIDSDTGKYQVIEHREILLGRSAPWREPFLERKTDIGPDLREITVLVFRKQTPAE